MTRPQRLAQAWSKWQGVVVLRREQRRSSRLGPGTSPHDCLTIGCRLPLQLRASRIVNSPSRIA